MARVNLKTVVQNVLDQAAEPVSTSLSSPVSSSSSSRPSEIQGFAYRAIQEVVEKMLLPLSDALIEGREPEQRVVAIVQQFLAHPDINSVISILARQQLGVNKRELVMDKLRDAIATHRNLRDQASL